jgi:hypothetical protein
VSDMTRTLMPADATQVGRVFEVFFYLPLVVDGKRIAVCVQGVDDLLQASFVPWGEVPSSIGGGAGVVSEEPQTTDSVIPPSS